MDGVIRREDLTEIGLVARGHAPGRTTPEEITFFKSVGVAVQDAAAAGAAIRRAEEAGVGTLIEL